MLYRCGSCQCFCSTELIMSHVNSGNQNGNKQNRIETAIAFSDIQ